MSADNEEQKAINNQYDDLKGVIADAARVKTDINSTCKESLKNMKRDFSGFMVDNVADEFKDVAERLGLFNGFADVEDKKKREKKIDGALKSFFGKMFKKAADFEYLKKGGKPKESTPPKADSYALDIITNLYASRLIPEVKRALDTAGIEIRFTKPITKLDLANNEDDKNTIIGYVTRAAEVQNEMFEKNAEIEDVIFENIPENMKYSESNPKGIKKAQFNALADLQAKTDELSMNGDAEKATDIVEKQCDKHFENSKNQEMLALVTELILTPNNEEPAPSPENMDEAVIDEAFKEGKTFEVKQQDSENDSKPKNLDKLVGEDMD